MGEGWGEVSVIDFVNMGNAGFSWPPDVMLGVHQTKLEVKSRRKSTRELKISTPSKDPGHGYEVLFLPCNDDFRQYIDIILGDCYNVTPIAHLGTNNHVVLLRLKFANFVCLICAFE